MSKRCCVVLMLCLVVSLVISSLAAGAKLGGTTIQSGKVTYWDGHYLAGQKVKTGFDIFGDNFQARTFSGYLENAFRPWNGEPPFAGDRSVDWWMDLRWNEAFLSNTDLDGDGHLDWHPFVDWAGSNHDNGDGNWQGSGAVISGTWSGPSWQEIGGEWVLVRASLQVTWAAVPADAYLEWVWMGPGSDPDGPSDDCYCPTWYEYPGGPELGYSWVTWTAGERLGWLVVKQSGHCGPLGQVCHYQSPTLSPGIGGPGG